MSDFFVLLEVASTIESEAWKFNEGDFIGCIL